MKEPAILAIIDIETTGHDPIQRITLNANTIRADNVLIPWHEITEIGCVFASNPGLEKIYQVHTFVKPEHPERCDPATIPITNFPERFKAGEWDSALSLNKAIWSLLMDCKRVGGDQAVAVPGGQNWFFDWSFLSVAFAWLDIPDAVHSKFLSYKRFDVSSMAIQELWDPREPLDMSDFSLRGGKLQHTLGIAPEPKPHLAINGARQAYDVMRKLNERKLLRLTTP